MNRCSVVIVSPLVQDRRSSRKSRTRACRLEDLPPHRPEGLEARLMALMQAAYLDSGITESVRIRKAEALAAGTIRWIRAKRLLAQLIAPSMVRPRSRYDVIDRLVSHPWADQLFDRHPPAMLVASSPGLIFSEVPLLRTAVRRGLLAMAVDPSWDNFTNKLLPVRRVNRLMVWNDLMKQQAIDLHGYQPDEVRIAGTPQWDHYFREGVGVSREAFFRRIGADPEQDARDADDDAARALPAPRPCAARARCGRFGTDAGRGPAQVLVRLHPRDEMEHYSEFEGVPDVILEKPFKPTVRAGDGLAVDITADSLRISPRRCATAM